MKEIQDKIKKFCENHNISAPTEHRVLDIISELEEVAKEVLKMSNYGKDKLKYREELKEELGDLLYPIIILANEYEIDLEDALEKVLEKYKKRLIKGSQGSESDWEQ